MLRVTRDGCRCLGLRLAWALVSVSRGSSEWRSCCRPLASGRYPGWRLIAFAFPPADDRQWPWTHCAEHASFRSPCDRCGDSTGLAPSRFARVAAAMERRFPVSRLTPPAVEPAGHQMRQYDSTPAPAGGRRGVFQRPCPMAVLAMFREVRKVFSNRIGGKAQGWSFI